MCYYYTLYTYTVPCIRYGTVCTVVLPYRYIYFMLMYSPVLYRTVYFLIIKLKLSLNLGEIQNMAELCVSVGYAPFSQMPDEMCLAIMFHLQLHEVRGRRLGRRPRRHRRRPAQRRRHSVAAARAQRRRRLARRRRRCRLRRVRPSGPKQRPY